MKRSFLLIALLSLSTCSDHKPAPVSHYGTTPGFGSAGAHGVLRNDTLWSISQRYNIAMQDIVFANNLRPPFMLEVGQRLRLPPPQTYTVRRGDSLYTISRLFGVTSSQLARQNDLRAPYHIYPGQVLRLPSLMTQQTRAAQRQVASSDHRERGSAPLPGQKPQAVSKPAVKTAKKKNPITKRTPPRSSGKFMKPVQGSIISTYGPKEGGLHNDGINILATRGAPVKAAENGVVVYAGNELKGSGNLILVRHQDRWMSAYAHLDDIKIKRGQTIKRGDLIGTVGSTGSVDTPQLHFELRRGTEAINPERYIQG